MKIKKNLQLCIASAPEDIDAAATIKVIRKAGTEFQACIASLEDILEEPLKTKFSEVKTQINTMLAGLPDTDKVPAALASNDVLQRLLGVLSTAQMMISNLQDTAKANASALATTKASIPTEIKAAIDAQIASGELITKEQHGKLITDATATATTAARAAAVTELQRVNDRKLALTTASLPIPGDKILTAEDADFEARKTTAAARVAELEPFKLPAERVLALAWDTDQAAYDQTLSLCKTVAEGAKKTGAPPNPMLNRTGSASPKKTIGGVC